MNSLVILPEELSNDGSARLVGERAIHAYETHGLRKGAAVKCGVYGGKVGDALVTESRLDEVRLDVAVTTDPPARIGARFFIAVPRPQTVKKVIQGAAMAGVEAVHFLRAERCDKSYLKSKAISGFEIQRQIILGLEQSGDTIPPKVQVNGLLHECLSEYSSRADSKSDIKIIADPRGAPLDFDSVNINDGNVAVLIGPELGWTAAEIRRAEEHGFVPARVGKRAVRVEIAMTYLIGILEYVRGGIAT